MIRPEIQALLYSWGAACQTADSYASMPGSAEEQEVERAVLALFRYSPIWAVVLRQEYTSDAGRREKALAASSTLNISITERRFLCELEFAHAWMQGRLSSTVVRRCMSST